MRKLMGFIFIIGFVSCLPNQPNTEHSLTVHLLGNPKKLNPISYSNATEKQLLDKIFQSLLKPSPDGKKLIPLLAQNLPEVKAENGKTYLIYTLNKKATWDNGQRVDVNDVVFSFKMLKHPLIDNKLRSAAYDFIEDIEIIGSDSTTFKIACHSYPIGGLFTTGVDPYILPEHLFDPKLILRKFTLKDYSTLYDSIAQDPEMMEYADYFNDYTFQVDPKNQSGSGAYTLSQWEQDQRIILHKKANWWGEKMPQNNVYFQAHPKTIRYAIVNDFTAAISALKTKDIDVMQGIPAEDYLSLLKTDSTKSGFHLNQLDYFGYTYLGLNTKDPLLSEVKIRKALRYLVDANRIIKITQQGCASPIKNPVHPSHSHYNHAVPNPSYDVEKANVLLKEAGFYKKNKEGFLFREKNGKKETLNLTLMVNAGHTGRKNTALIIKEDAAKAGVDIQIEELDSKRVLEKMMSHHFQMYFGAWGLAVGPDSPSQLFHQKSIKGGSNFCGFGDSISDAQIDAIENTLDETLRTQYWMEFQEKFYQECPYIFLYVPNNKIAISKTYQQPIYFKIPPYFWEGNMQLTEK